MPTGHAREAVQLRVELRDVTPTVWRRLVVPTSLRLDRLAEVLVIAMGWENVHQHRLQFGDVSYGLDPEGDCDELDETTVTLSEALGGLTRFVLEYDFGDDWTHHVTVEAVNEQPVAPGHGPCIAGANACPPEDCGGPEGFRQLVGVLAMPSHPDHEDCVRWVGEDYDAAQFDVADCNAALRKLTF